MEKKLSHSDLLAFRKCPQQYWYRVRRMKRAPRTVQQVVGDITHAATATETSQRQALAARELVKLPVKQRAEVTKLVDDLITAADEMSQTQTVSELRKEKQLRWLDSETGWTLMAKPDEIGMVGKQRGGKMLQIVDNKTAYRLRWKHKHQLYFFALVLRLSWTYSRAIRLVVRLLRSRKVEVFYSAPHRAAEELKKVRQTILAIESRLATGNFEAVVGRHCKDCPYRNACSAYQAGGEPARASKQRLRRLPIRPTAA